MNRSYHDIISRIAEPPSWWQEGGIPRYDVFHPKWSTGVYAQEVALAEIACQHTGVQFVVAFEGGRDHPVAKAIRDYSLAYGDPPNVPEVSLFDSTITRRIIQYWFHDQVEHKWHRDTKLEVAFPTEYFVEPAGFWAPSAPDETPSVLYLRTRVMRMFRWRTRF